MDKRNFSWLALITFCSAAAIVAALALAAVFAGATLAFAVGQSAESGRAITWARTPKAFSRVITDSHCGARHTMSDKSSAECSRACVRKGARYVLVNSDRVYALNGSEAELDKLAGQRVTAEGTVTGNTITVSSVADQ